MCVEIELLSSNMTLGSLPEVWKNSLEFPVWKVRTPVVLEVV